MNSQESGSMSAAGKSFEILPFSDDTGMKQERGFKRMELTSSQKVQISGFLEQIPSLMAADAMSNAFVLKFPEGFPHDISTLMHYQSGGLGTPIMGEGGVAAHASLHGIQSQAVLFGAFTAMSIATSQYFLAEISNELKMINLNIDKILEFLYGDKKAELMAEVGFTQYAYQNYASIMAHEAQRIATIASLQESRKIAVKDIEFYLSDLDSTVNSGEHSQIERVVQKAFQMKDSLELSTQLYVASNLLEVFYTQNQDPNFLSYLERDMLSYIDKCEKRILGSFSVLNRFISGYKGNILKKIDKSSFEREISVVVNSFYAGMESPLRKAVRTTLQHVSQTPEYYLSRDGDLYLKTS